MNGYYLVSKTLLQLLTYCGYGIEVGDVLVIAGDVGYLVDTTIPHLRFWKWASENYRQELIVAGNHEYYNNGDVAAQGESWQKMFSRM